MTTQIFYLEVPGTFTKVPVVCKQGEIWLGYVRFPFTQERWNKLKRMRNADELPGEIFANRNREDLAAVAIKAIDAWQAPKPNSPVKRK